MAISNDDELVKAADEASRLLAEISEYTGRALNEKAKIRFPRGVIRTADTLRSRMPTYLDYNKRSHCAYTYMHIDVLWWLSSRTDIKLVAKQMIIRSAIIHLSSILEVCVYIKNGPGLLSKNNGAGVNRRIEYLLEIGIISKSDCSILCDLWNNRNRIHAKQLDDSEFGRYNLDHINPAQQAMDRLLRAMQTWHDARTTDSP